MPEALRVIKLLKNRLYPTYQLHAFMANDKTAPRDGLRLAALTAMRWLMTRMGDGVPEEWNALPAPEDYLNTADADLPSLYLNQGHVINVVSLLDQGMWTLQITEPDLSSDPGNPEQKRPAVPGRVIETNIGFRIVGQQLECGFKTVISDPVGTEPEAEVYRLAVVKQLMKHPDFGLKQVVDLTMRPTRISGASQVKTMLWVTRHADNELPTVVFTQPLEARTLPAPLAELAAMRSQGALPTLPLPSLPAPLPLKPEPAVAEPPYDLDKFSYYTFSHCRTYLLEHAARKAFVSQSGIDYSPGDILVLWPTALGGGDRVCPLKQSSARRTETLRALESDVKAYTKDKPLTFGHIVFLSDAREKLIRRSDELLQSAEDADVAFRQEQAQREAVWKSELAKKDRELEAAADQLRRQKDYAARLEGEKSKLREAFSQERDKLRTVIDSKDEMIAFLRRRYDQPQDYEGVAFWVEKHFPDRLILHPKAVARLNTKAAQCASVGLICDALDFLATDYWEQRYRQLPKDVALTRCSEKYGRPFTILPTGAATIDYTPWEYRIPYFTDAQGHVMDSDLESHLRVGNEPENLLRIYFLHDDAAQRIVVGSLPDHLRAVTVR